MLVTFLRVVAYLTAGLAAMLGAALTAHVHSVRWHVKTLADSMEIPAQAVATSIIEQRGLIAPRVDESTPRLPAERTLYCLRARLIEAYLETDRDYHLVLEDTATRELLIAEIPDGIDPVPSTYRTYFYHARRTVDSLFGMLGPLPFRPLDPPLVEITGIGFFDESHVLTPPGMSPNCREIHPVLTLRAISR